MGKFLEPTKIEPELSGLPEPKSSTKPQYVLPIGNLAIQVRQNESVLHFVFSLDVFFQSAIVFDKLNGAQGKTDLRDTLMSINSELAQGPLWLTEGDETTITEDLLARKIVSRLHQKHREIRGVRIQNLRILRVKK